MVDETKTAGANVALADDKSNALVDADFFLDGAQNTMDDFGQGDFLVPYIRIMQALSKELQKGHQKYIKGAEAGQFINSATKELWDGEKGFWVIPIAFSHRYQAWRPNNGGPGDDYGSDDTVYKSLIPNDKGKRVNGDGNEVTDANQYFVFIVDKESGEYQMGVLSMSGSQAKKARQWNSKIANSRATHPKTGAKVSVPMYYFAYHLTAVPESNEQGNWYGFSIGESVPVPGLPNAKDIFEAAKDYRERIEAGEIKTQAEEFEASSDSDEEEKAF